MDHWTGSTWRNRADHPTLRAVPGHAVRVLPRAGGTAGLPGGALDDPAGYHWPVEDDEPDGIRVLVAGDDVLARRGVLAALDDEPGMIVVGEHRTGPAVFATLAARHPDVLLLHGLRAADAAEVLAAVRRSDRVVRVLLIGMRDGETLAGPDVCGSLPAPATPEEVVAAVRIAAAGFSLHRTEEEAADDRAGQLVCLTEQGDTEVSDGANRLSARECDVLALVARGMSNAEIAAELTVSEHTAESHVQHLLSKLGLRNRIHAVIYAFESGLVRSGHP
jgi:DNA-binding NarL/FixJ family response regulator